VRRYPFLVGADPSTLPGIAELADLVDEGCALVVTTDPIHHGHAYGSAPDECCADDDPATMSIARAAIDAQLSLLSEHRFEEFEGMTARHRSDFRDTGPAMAFLLGAGFTYEIHDLALVDYAEALHAVRPSWVAGALVSVQRAEPLPPRNSPPIRTPDQRAGKRRT
jgi:hypothetical protein